MQPIILRDYQSKVLADEATQHAAGHQRTLIVAPTGSGKSVVISAAARDALASDDRQVLITAPRRELVAQLSGTLSRYGLAHSHIATGHEYDPSARLFVCGIDALRARIERGVIDPACVGRVIVDEASHSVAPTWQRTIEAFSTAHITGLTATPERLSGEGLGDVYSAMVLGPTPRELIARGMLSRYIAYCPQFPDLKGVARARGGDYATGELAQRMDKPGLTGNAVAQYRKLIDGALTIGFAVNVAHAAHLAEAFTRAGIPAAYVDGSMRGERGLIVRRFAEGHIRVLFSAELLSEGVDIAALAGRDVQVKAVLLLRPTQSLALHLQQVGRMMRPSADGLPGHVLDFAGNIMDANGDINLGFPDDHHAWSLDGKAKRKPAEESEFLPAPPVRCSECYTTHRRPAPDNCTVCGASLVAAPVIPKPKKGELAAIKAEEARQRAAQRAIDAEVKADLQAIADAAAAAAAEAKARELRACKTLADLEAFGKKHRHKPLWAIAYWSHMKANKRPGYTGHGKKREVRQPLH